MDISSAIRDPDEESIVDYKYIIGNPTVAAGSSITNTGVLMLRGSDLAQLPSQSSRVMAEMSAATWTT